MSTTVSVFEACVAVNGNTYSWARKRLLDLSLQIWRLSRKNVFRLHIIIALFQGAGPAQYRQMDAI